jgi:bacteriocin-like protein
MRNNTGSQIVTAELSDNELDQISGGIASASVQVASVGVHVGIGDAVDAIQDVVGALPLSPLTGLATVQTSH